jgi:hypothetical protein
MRQPRMARIETINRNTLPTSVTVMIRAPTGTRRLRQRLCVFTESAAGSAVKDEFDQRQDRQPARTNRNTTAAPFAMSSTPRSRKPPSTSTTTPGTVPRASATTPDPAHRGRSSSAIRRRRRLLSPPANRSTTWQGVARPLPAPKLQATTTHRLPRLSLRSSGRNVRYHASKIVTVSAASAHRYESGRHGSPINRVA